MDSEYSKNLDYGYLLSQTQTKLAKLFDNDFYSLLLNSSNLTDIIAKLGHSSYKDFVNEGIKKEKKELRKALFNSFKKELNDIERLIPRKCVLYEMIEYMKRNYVIGSFLYSITSKKSDVIKVEEGELGYFDEINALPLANSVSEALELMEDKNFIKIYLQFFREGLKENLCENDFQKLATKFYKKNLDDFHSEMAERGLLTISLDEVLKEEGNKMIFEGILNKIELSQELDLEIIPNTHSLQFDDLQSLYAVKNKEDFINSMKNTNYKKFFSEEEHDFLKLFKNIELEKMKKIFDNFNDVVSVYCYLKLKENEIRNIIWTVEMFSCGKKELDHF